MDPQSTPRETMIGTLLLQAVNGTLPLFHGGAQALYTVVTLGMHETGNGQIWHEHRVYCRILYVGFWIKGDTYFTFTGGGQFNHFWASR
jgi:hypothetical protein